MNEVFENNMKFAPLLRFYYRYKVIILSSLFAVIAITAIGLFLSVTSKINHEKAAVIYNEWLEQDSQVEIEKNKADELLNELITAYKKTGYTKLALLNSASMSARDGDGKKALEGFTILVNLTDGLGSNKLYNKLARVSSARLLSSDKQYDAALNMLEKYSSKSTDAYIHELTGDILLKKNEILLAKNQYLLAKDKYIDEASQSIISMKLANIES
jgi:predicted negative regulator of RcsB-dependent stress response|tara:strand:+ start:211 stop:855 length:645 start_codon:yes stop_codon:yes gene_type:complete